MARADPHRSPPVSVDRRLIERTILVLQNIGAVSHAWWPYLYDVRDELCAAINEPPIARPVRPAHQLLTVNGDKVDIK